MNLIEATIKNDVDTVSKLLSQGADPDCTEDLANVTPLHYAAQNDCLECALYLITAGAKTSTRTNDGYTPMDIAKLHHSNRMIDFLAKLNSEISTYSE